MKAIFILLAGIVVVAFLISLSVVTWKCNTYQEVTGRETKIAALSCYANIGGQWELVRVRGR